MFDGGGKSELLVLTQTTVRKMFVPEGINPQSFEFEQPVPLQVPQTEMQPDTRYELFNLMYDEVETNPNLGLDQAKYLLELAFKDSREAQKLKERLTRPSGFDNGGGILYF
jgi:hypothetical protein